MNFLIFFQPHLRLIYVFLCGLIVSTMTHISTLIILNLIVFSGLLIALIRYQKSLAGYFKYWLKLNFFTLLVWLTLSWKITEQGIALNPIGIQLALLITLRFNLILSLTRLLLIDMNESLLLQALRRLPLPKKLLHLFVLTVRYISVFSEVHKKMDMAMRARGYQPKLNSRTLFIAAQRVALLLIMHSLKQKKQKWR